MELAQFEQNVDKELRHWWFRGRRRILLQIIAAKAEAGARVLEVGCGTGGNADALNRVFRVTGIDVSADAINFAKSRFPEVDFRQGVAPDDILDVCREADVFLIADVLEHVQDDFQLLASLCQEAKPGAWFVLTVPADMELWSPHDISHEHFRRYSIRGFSALWSDLNLRQHLLSPFNSRLYPAIRCVRSLTRRLNVSAGAAGTDLHLPPSFVNNTLENLFAGESRRLRSALTDEKVKAYRRGVSLIAVLQKEPNVEKIAPDHQPDWIRPQLPPSLCRGIVTTSRAKKSALPGTHVVIVIPCFNEAQRLQTETFISYLKNESENVFLMFVDDGSSDDTLSVLRSMQQRLPEQISILRLPENCGKAEATRLGIGNAMLSHPRFVAFLDADLATPLAEVTAMIKLMAANPSTSVVIGARVRLLGRRIHRSVMRHYLGRFAASLISLLLHLPVYDSQCGAKVFRCNDTARHVFYSPFLSRWLFDVEILRRYGICHATEQKVSDDAFVEFPLNEWRDVQGSKLRIRHFATALLDLIYIFLSRWSIDQSGDPRPERLDTKDNRG